MKDRMKIGQIVKQFNWRFMLVRILVNAVALAFTAFIVPKISFVDKSIWNWLFLAIMLGILNALVKPILQFLTLQFLFVTYGLTIVVVNTLILMLLSFLFPFRFAVDNLLWAFVGGLVLGLLSSFLESLLGLTMPIVDHEPPDLRQHLEQQSQSVTWLVPTGTEPVSDEQVQVKENVGPDSSPTPGESRPQEDDLQPALEADGGASEPPALEPDGYPASDDSVLAAEEKVHPPEEGAAESIEAGDEVTAQAVGSLRAESMPEAQDEAKEGLS